MNYLLRSQQKSSQTTHTGFTLIELLVVVSIIALLSTIILSSIQDARIKAENTQKEEITRQYMSALELYRSKYGSYPGTYVNDNTWVCVGFTSADSLCVDSPIADADISVNTAFAEFIPGPPRSEQEISISDVDFSGIWYQPTNSNKSGYRIRYYLKETHNCNVGSYEEFSVHSQCTVTSFEN